MHHQYMRGPRKDHTDLGRLEDGLQGRRHEGTHPPFGHRRKYSCPWGVVASELPPPPAPNWGTIDELFGKDDLEDYFNNFAAAATNNKSVLGHLTTAIASLTTNNKKLVATNAKLIAEVTIITNRMVGKAANGGKATNRYVAKE